MRQDPYLVVLILLGHGLFLRLSFALVAVVLKPNFHLKEAEAKEHVSTHGKYRELTYQFQRPTAADNQFPAHRWFVDGNITTPPSLPSKPAPTAATSNNNNQIMINYIASKLRKKSSLCFAPCSRSCCLGFGSFRFCFVLRYQRNEIKLVSVLCKIVFQSFGFPSVFRRNKRPTLGTLFSVKWCVLRKHSPRAML